MVFIIGGGQIYKEVWVFGLVSELFIICVNEWYEVDMFLVDMDIKDWKVEKVMEYGIDEKYVVVFDIFCYFK